MREGRRLIGLLVLVAAAAGVYLWWPAGPRAPEPLEATREVVVFLGDSITSGHGLPLGVTFPHRLGAALGVPVRNAGISGDVTGGGLRRLDTDVLAHRPRLVVVELGVNDAFRRLPREETLGNLRAIVRRLREDGAGVLLLHIGLAALGSDAYRDGFREIATTEGAWLVEDFLDGVVPGFTTDGLHPSEEGHARLAARLEPTLREILGR
ncbi:MAG: GDSL-type esterase/lipase family protein [Candidatus Rokuibacteriota bacterium]